MAASLVSRPAAAPAHDDLDDLFDYNVNTDDVFRDVDTNMNVPARAGSVAPRPAQPDSGAGLGIDEEIQVVKTRKPVPKLDEDRSARTWKHPECEKLTTCQTLIPGGYPKAEKDCEREIEI